MDQQQAIRQYREFMRRIKYRTDVIRRTEAAYRLGTSITGYRQTDIDLCYLQLRKCLELMMFASVIAHNSFGRNLGKRLRDKEWNASRIVASLKRVNPGFYPVPVKDATPPGSRIRNVEKLEHGFLTEFELCDLYDKCCGNMLHASRKDPYGDRMPVHFRDIREYGDKLVRLLSHHWIHITDEIALAVLMHTESDGDVQVTQFQHISEMPPDLADEGLGA